MTIQPRSLEELGESKEEHMLDSYPECSRCGSRRVSSSQSYEQADRDGRRGMWFKQPYVCFICGDWMTDVEMHIRRKHGMSADKYATQYPKSLLENNNTFLYGRKADGRTLGEKEHDLYIREVGIKTWNSPKAGVHFGNLVAVD